MSNFSADIGSDFNRVLKLTGQQVRFRYFTYTPTSSGSTYDDSLTLTQSGVDFWVSGCVQVISTPKGNDEAALWAQGRLLYGDQRLYVAGNVSTSGLFKIWIGSPVVQEYAADDQGQNAWSINGVTIYKKLFVRFLPTGSLASE